jgi:putative FmdB family regulatory protein
MPVYDYKCPVCGSKATITHSLVVTPRIVCHCGAEKVRVMSVPAVSFKGKGWGKDAQQ